MRRPANPPAAALHASPDDVEAQFYEALQRGDVALLMAAWADDEIVCVHPGGGRVVGPAAIRASFEAVFANGGVPAHPEQIHRLQSLGCAVHHLVERIVVESPEGRQEAWVMATNVYVKTAQGWRMAAHHASPASPDEPAAADTAPSTLH
ncbi:MAG: nuclear transport factor 2 family protein [Rubrivivax sp.]